MAKAVTQAFKDHWKKKHGQKVVLSMQIQKRYIDTPTSIVYTGVWEELDQGLQVREFPRMTKALDYPFKNVFKTATITVSVPNIHNEWIPTATAPSIFAGDNTAPNGYFAPLTKIRFRFGYRLASGDEFTDQFTGFLLNIRPTGRSAYADLTIASSMHVFEDLEIDNIVDTFVLEDAQPATGDGSNSDFLSTSKGIKSLTAVEVNAVPVNQGDFELNNVDDVDEGEILIRTAPPAGQTVKQSGEKWKQDIKIEDAVALIFDEAGIVPADRQIDPAIFAGVSASRSWDTKSEWDAGILTNIDSETEDGSIIQNWALIDDFADGDFINFRTWLNGFGDTTGWSVVSNALKGSTPTRDLYISNVTGDFGTWEWENDHTSGQVDFGFVSIPDGGFFLNPPARLQYFMRFTSTQMRLFRGNSATSPAGSPTETILATENTAPVNGDIFRISRDDDGEMKFYLNNVLKFTVTDTGAESGFGIIRCRAISGVGTFDEIYHTPIVVDEAHGAIPSNWESEVVDVGSVPTAWGTLDRFETLTGSASILYETFSSDTVDFTTGNDPSGYVAIGGSGQVLSALKQFIKVRAIVTVDRLIETAQVDKLTLNFQVASITLSVAIFRGKDGIAQLEQFARLVNYQLGAEDGGLTFFRAPTNSGSVLTLTQENSIIDVLDWSPGWDRVKNIGSVRYGNYTATFGKTEAGEAEPTSERQFGKKIATDNLTDLLLANDVQLGDARAQVLYEDLFRPKRRLIIQAWLVPWLELDDVITIDYFDHPILKAFFWYDPLQAWGGDYFSMGDAENVLARSLDMRILEIDQDPVNPNTPSGITAKYTLEEILA